MNLRVSITNLKSYRDVYDTAKSYLDAQSKNVGRQHVVIQMESDGDLDEHDHGAQQMDNSSLRRSPLPVIGLPQNNSSEELLACMSQVCHLYFLPCSDLHWYFFVKYPNNTNPLTKDLTKLFCNIFCIINRAAKA